MPDCDKSLGQIVDDMADKFFAQGNDALTSGLMALRYVALVIETSLDFLGLFRKPDPAPSEEVAE